MSKIFKRKLFKPTSVAATAELQTDTRRNWLDLGACFTFYNYQPNDGVSMTNYEYNLYFSKIKMAVKQCFKRHFDNELIIYSFENPDKPAKASIRKKQYITISILMKEIEGLDLKKDYDKQIQDFLNEAYDIILNYKWFI